MTRRAFLTISKLILLLSMLLVCASQILFYLNRSTPMPASWDFAAGTRSSLIDWLHFSSLGALLPAVAGAFSVLITGQRPTHPIGWLLSLLGLTASVSTFAGEWAIYGYYTVIVGLPGALMTAWVKNWVWMFVMIIVGLILGLVAEQVIGNQLVNNSFILPLVSIGIGITRHRLYDIDLIIRRTLVYTSVTLLLVAVYLGGVTLLQSIFTSITGQQSTVAIVISTLGIAALFNPLRSRVQYVIDRRFYRHKYSAEQTLAEFAAAARAEVGLKPLTGTLVTVVQETIQPERVTLWLREIEE